METRLDAATALLVELLRGPGYGLDLIERILRRGGGRIALPQGIVYPALGELVREGALRSWSFSTPGSGRPRIYYGLTPGGIVRAESCRAALAVFSERPGPARPAVEDAEKMAKGIEDCLEISEFTASLVLAGKAAGL